MEELFGKIQGERVAVTLPKADTSGVDYFAESLINDLEEKGFEVLEVEFPSSSYPVLEDTLNTGLGFRRKIKDLEANSIIFTDYNHSLGVHPGKVDAEVFLTVHHLTEPGNPFQRIIHWINTRRLKQADNVIAASEYTDSILDDKYGIDSIVYDQGVKDLPEGELPEEVEKPYLLYVGNHRPRKKIPLMVEAFEKVAERNDELMLVLAGNHRGAEETREIIREKDLEDRIIVTGKVSEEELGRLYQDAEIYLHTAEEEGYARTIREALKKDTDVVAVENDITKSLLEETIPAESEAIAEEVIKVINE